MQRLASLKAEEEEKGGLLGPANEEAPSNVTPLKSLL
jgi:hypothetical protein